MKCRLKMAVKLVMIFVMVFILAGCSNTDAKNSDSNRNDKPRIKIVTTLFPYYDFVRAVVGNVKGVSLEMTVTPGQDSHSFEPTPKDVINIDEADLFIYNGGSIENWVDTVLDSLDKKQTSVMRMMDFVDVMEEETAEGMDLRFEEHHEENEELENEYDEHIWTSPENAMLMVRYICDELCKIDSEYEQSYKKNAEAYIDKIKKIDTEFKQIVERMNNKEIVFADRFPLLYFTKTYGLKYYAAFPGCGSDMEPSAKTIAFLIDKVKADKIDKVYYLELSSPTVAQTICEDTGAKPVKFNTCHNITEKQFKDGVTYVDLMQENVENMREDN